MNVPDQGGPFAAKSLFPLGIAGKQALELGGIGHLIHADVDDRGSRLNKVACNHAGASDGGNQDVGPPTHPRQVTCLGMADGHGGGAVYQQQGSWLTYNVASSYVYCFLALYCAVDALENLNDA